MAKKYRGISLFSGAGGMDIGFKRAGIEVLVANEIDKHACITYNYNHSESFLIRGDIREHIEEIGEYDNIDVIFGGPPCQGFSVAGKMDPYDERSTLIWSFLDVVKKVKPKSFVIENVKALATLKKWSGVKNKIIQTSNDMGYSCYPFILNSAEFGVPQKRERVFFIGFKDKHVNEEVLLSRFDKYKCNPKTIREIIGHLGPAGSESNPKTCVAKITLAGKPVMRKSPYAGMIFNGIGRPLNLDGASSTLPASMGGNKTPIVDEGLLYNNEKDDWVVEYHKGLREGMIEPKYGEAPSRLRRLTAKEAALLQTFPEDYEFKGTKTAIYKQIGNAVPCDLAQVVANVVIEELENRLVNLNETLKESSFNNLKKVVQEFVKERDWEKFHNPKNLSMSIAIESAELMELFQWKSIEESVNGLSSEDRANIKDEVADIMIYCLSLCNKLNIDIEEAILKKMEKNKKKYPKPNK